MAIKVRYVNIEFENKKNSVLEKKMYSTYIDFGKKMNQNIRSPFNSANPLSYCMRSTLNSNFLHGSATGSLLYSNHNQNCDNFMAQRCAEDFDGFCEAYIETNKESFYPNEGSIDAQSEQFANLFLKYNPTPGEYMLRNAACRKYLDFPNTKPSYQQFDPTVANSPIIKVYANYTCGSSVVVNLDDPKTINECPLMRKMLQIPKASFDIFARIYLAYFIRQEHGVNIKGTRLEDFLRFNSDMFERYIEQAVRVVPSFRRGNYVGSACNSCSNLK